MIFLKLNRSTVLLLFSASLFLLGNIKLFGQNKSKRPSPPAIASQEFKGAKISVEYSSPAVKERVIWNNLVPYGKIWRTGANEATVITFDKAVKIQGHLIQVGKYSLFTIPNNNEWEIIFNSKHEQWGAFNYDSKFDVLRIKVKPEVINDYKERLEFEIAKRTPEKGVVNLLWEKLKISFDFEMASVN